MRLIRLILVQIYTIVIRQKKTQLHLPGLRLVVIDYMNDIYISELGLLSFVIIDLELFELPLAPNE